MAVQTSVIRQKLTYRNATALAFLATMVVTAALSSSASAIMAGAAPDTPAARVDPNTTSSPWAGVGSVVVNGSPYSGTLIGRRYVITAGHVAAGANPASVRFVLNYGGDQSHNIGAVAVYGHPDFAGFNPAVPNNDLAIIELEQEVPAGVPIYPINRTALAKFTTLYLVGYGASGNGNVGPTIGGSETVKRVGRNNADYFRLDDKGSGLQEVYYWDFDGGGATNYLGGAGLGNAIESTVAGGDSGSAALIPNGAGWALAGVNTFTATFTGGPTTASTFGTAGGGQSLAGYTTWIDATIAAAEVKYQSSGDVPTLPEWGMLILGCMLATSLMRRPTGQS
jgi:hypothetical protein